MKRLKFHSQNAYFYWYSLKIDSKLAEVIKMHSPLFSSPLKLSNFILWRILLCVLLLFPCIHSSAHTEALPDSIKLRIQILTPNSPIEALTLIQKRYSDQNQNYSETDQAWLSLQKGLIFKEGNHSALANIHFRKALLLYSQIPNDSGMAFSFFNLGLLYPYSDSSIFLLHQSIFHFKKTKNLKGLNQAYLSLGKYYCRSQNSDSLYHYTQLVHQNSEANFLQTSTSRAYLLEARFLLKKAEAKKALPKLGKALSISIRNQDTLQTIEVYFLKAQAYTQLGLYDSVLHFNQSCLTLSLLFQQLHFQEKAMGIMAQIKLDRNDTVSSWQWLKQKDSISYLIRQNDNSNEIALLEQEYDNQLKNKEFITLQSQFKSEVQIRILLILLLVGIALLGFYIFRSQRLKRRKEKEVMLLKNKEMEGERDLASAQLEVIQLQQKNLNEQLKYTQTELNEFSQNFVESAQTLKLLQQNIGKLRRLLKNPLQRDQLTALSVSVMQLSQQSESRRILSDKSLPISDQKLHLLQQQMPQLTDLDMELLQLILLGISAQEIAQLYNIEEPSVMTKRYRLRKKLGLEKGENFEDFIEHKLNPPADV